MKKNLRKISNYSIAGLLMVGVIFMSFFAYKAKVQADTILPGYATAHLNIHVTVPTIQSVPFKVTFLPTSSSRVYYFKERTFALSGAGLNTIEWYIRKIPSGTYKVVIESNGKELSGSSVEISLVNDKVNDAGSFDLYLGEPIPSPIPSPIQTQAPVEQTLPDPDYDQNIPADEEVPEDSPADPDTDSPPSPSDYYEF